jgi:hypothetical membrane protein
MHRSVPWWAVASSTVAPLAMIGGWSLAAALQPPGYSSTRQTISALAAHGAHDRWVMTAGLAIVGLCHVTTAIGLRRARVVGRLLLALGGLATAAVAALPQPAAGHPVAAGVAFVALSCWPVAAHTNWSAATVVSLGLLAVFFLELRSGGGQLGTWERLLAGGQSLWPAVLIWTADRSRHPQQTTADLR